MAMSDEWVPPAMDAESFARLTAVERGFPTYMRQQVVGWIIDSAKAPGGYFMTSVPNALSLRLRMEIPTDYTYFWSFLDAASDETLANLIDAMFFFEIGNGRRQNRVLAGMLDAGMSEWDISYGTGMPRLTARIPDGVVMSFEDVINKSALAGKLLAEAFEAAYGTSPNPNHAYDLSVKAVETLACPAFIPKNTTRATLGAVIGHLEQKTVSLPLIEKHANHGETITKMMRLLWEGGQRHGDGNYEHISLSGAKTAHALAVSLVSMLHEGVVATS